MKDFLYRLFLLLIISLISVGCSDNGRETKQPLKQPVSEHKESALENSAIENESDSEPESSITAPNSSTTDNLKTPPATSHPSDESVITPKLSTILHPRSEYNITKFGAMVSLLPIDKNGIIYLLSEDEGLIKATLQDDGMLKVLNQQWDYYYLHHIVRVDSKRLLVADGYDGLYLLQDDANLTPISHFQNDAFATVTLDRRQIAYTAFGSQGVLVHDLTHSDLSRPIATYDSQGYAQTLAFGSSADVNHTILFLGDGFDGVKVLDVNHQKDISLMSRVSSDGWVSDVAYDTSKKYLYVASSEGGIEIDDLSDLRHPKTLVLYDFNETVTSLSLSSDKSLLFAGSDEGSVWFFQTDANQTLKSRYHLHFDAKINDLIYQQEGQRLYIATDSGLFIYHLVQNAIK